MVPRIRKEKVADDPPINPARVKIFLFSFVYDVDVGSVLLLLLLFFILLLLLLIRTIPEVGRRLYVWDDKNFPKSNRIFKNIT